LSARAAVRLETLGFERVFRYTPGKVDWFAARLPREGRLASQPRAGDVAHVDVPTCRLNERVGDVAQRARNTGRNVCVVLHDDRVVLGLLDAASLNAARIDHALVTDADGRLIGWLERADLERRLADERGHPMSS